MIKYVFFDLDETLIDIKHAQNEAIKSLFNKYDFVSKTDEQEFINTWDKLTDYHYKFYTQKQISYSEQRKRRIVDLFKTFKINLTKDPLAVYDEYLKTFEESWKTFDDVKPTLTKLKNKFKLGIISNGDYDQQVQKTQKTNIFDFFSYINTSSEFKFSKPNPEIFSNIFNLHNIPFDEVVYIGDSYDKDILPCKALNITAILINRKNKTYNDDELIQINDLNKLESIIENL